jgi:FtsH-binding integral membrane protein
MYDTMTADVYRDAPAVNQAMGRVYFHMMCAVIVSMLVSYFVGTDATLMQFFFTGAMKWLVIFAPLVAVFGITIALNANPPHEVAVTLLHGFAALMGLSFAGIFVIFSMGSIFTAFMGSAVLFAVMSLYGYFTKRDLSGLSQMLFVALIAIVIASLINMFIGSSVFQMVISAIAIVIFLGFTAYDTQQIREMVSVETNEPVEIIGALTLYLDFINLFINLLQIIGVTPNKDE